MQINPIFWMMYLEGTDACAVGIEFAGLFMDNLLGLQAKNSETEEIGLRT